jgi:xanthine dehydrogenase molybdopterin-binding subunit B
MEETEVLEVPTSNTDVFAQAAVATQAAAKASVEAQNARKGYVNIVKTALQHDSDKTHSINKFTKNLQGELRSLEALQQPAGDLSHEEQAQFRLKNALGLTVPDEDPNVALAVLKLPPNVTVRELIANLERIGVHVVLSDYYSMGDAQNRQKFENVISPVIELATINNATNAASLPPYLEYKQEAIALLAEEANQAH